MDVVHCKYVSQYRIATLNPHNYLLIAHCVQHCPLRFTVVLLRFVYIHILAKTHNEEEEIDAGNA